MRAWQYIDAYRQFASNRHAKIWQGMVVTAITYWLQVWVIEKKGPVFISMFTPVALIITAVFSAFLWKETLYWGRFVTQTSTKTNYKNHLIPRICQRKNKELHDILPKVSINEFKESCRKNKQFDSWYRHHYPVVIASDHRVLTIDSFSLNSLWQSWWGTIAGCGAL